MEGRSSQGTRRRRGSFRVRVAVVFALQTIVMITASLMAANNVAPIGAAIAIMLCSGSLAWLAVSREWVPVAALARLLDAWDPEKPDMAGLDREGGKHADGDVSSLIRGLHGLASRIEGYTTRELEALVEAFLILSRESDQGLAEEDFVVNTVLRQEVDYARELIVGRPVELVLDEPASFALHASPRVFAVLCGQLIRHALQQTDQGTIMVTVMPGSVSVINPALDVPEAGSRRHASVDRHGFDLAIARRLSDRFQWPLELRSLPGANRIASVRFPHPQPVES